MQYTNIFRFKKIMNVSFLKTFISLIYFYLRINEACSAKSMYDPTQSYSFPTNWPINVNSDTLKPVVTEKPLQFTAGFIERALVLNTGKSAIVEINQTRTSDTISDGVLGPNTYIYEFCRFYWVNDTNGRAGSTINGRGEPLEVLLYYWNKKYGSFSEAKHHRDGLAVFALPIKVGALPNPFFVLFQEYLVQVKKAHTQVPALLSFTYLWYVLFLTQYYYAYPGSYYDEDNGNLYYCATIILHPEVFMPFIHSEQFQAFLDLRDDKGQPLINQAPLYRNNGQPIVKATGVSVFPYLT